MSHGLFQHPPHSEPDAPATVSDTAPAISTLQKSIALRRASCNPKTPSGMDLGHYENNREPCFKQPPPKNKAKTPSGMDLRQ